MWHLYPVGLSVCVTLGVLVALLNEARLYIYIYIPELNNKTGRFIVCVAFL